MTSSGTRHFRDNVELYLTGIGIAVIFGLPALIDFGSATLEIAIIAVGVGLLHGLIFWTLRRRQRQMRRELLREIREKLSRRVDEKLGRVLANIQPPDRELTGEDRERLTEVAGAVREIAATIEALSLETLTSWSDSPGD